MGKTAAQRKKEQRERLKVKGQYQAFKEKEARKQNERRQRKKASLTVDEIDILRAKKRKEIRKYRKKKKLQLSTEVDKPNPSTPTAIYNTPSKIYKTKSAYGKALAKAKRGLPFSPNKRKAVVKKLAEEIAPEIVSPKSSIKHARAGLSLETKEIILDFYQKDSISYQAPGLKDYVIIRENNKKRKIQKRYLFMTLGETFELFKKDNPDVEVGMSKFSDLRPSHIRLRHETPENLCLCIYHENVNLLLADISLFPNHSSDLIKMIVCEDAEDCMTQKCENCRDLKKLCSIVDTVPDSELEKEITYLQWITDESGKVIRQKISSSVCEAIDALKEKLGYFLWHVFVQRCQASYLDMLRKELPAKTILLHFDFSENYCFKYQDEIQSAHWTSTACTIYTAMSYFISEDKQVSIPIVVISEYMHHDKYAVYIFNEIIINKIKEDYPHVSGSRLIFLSDGTGQHFKQKYSLCLATLRPENVEWHFFATGHGKGPIDGLGGTIKRRVREATISRKVDPHSAKEFAECAKYICPNIIIIYVPEYDVISQKSQIDNLCTPEGKEICTIPDTRKMHCFIKVEPYKLKVAQVSKEPKKFKTFDFVSGVIKADVQKREVLQDFKTGDWVLIPYPGKKLIKHFAGQIISHDESVLIVKFLQYDKELSNFTWPVKEESVEVDVNDTIIRLPEPDFDRRLRYSFKDFNFSLYVMG